MYQLQRDSLGTCWREHSPGSHHYLASHSRGKEAPNGYQEEDWSHLHLRLGRLVSSPNSYNYELS